MDDKFDVTIIGRANEAALAACAVKALDGGMQIQRAPQSERNEYGWKPR